MQASRSNALLAAGLATSGLLLAVRSLRVTPDPELVAQAWPATALTAVVLLLLPSRYTRVVAGLAVLLLLAVCLITGRGPVFSVGFALANGVEAMLVLRWLTGFDVERPELRTWLDYRRWLLGIAVASCAAGSITAVTIGLAGGEELWRPMLWVALTHFGALAVTLPLFMRRPSHHFKVRAIEIASHVVLIGLCALACLNADRSEPVAFLLLPLLMWAAARFSPTWVSIEVLAVSIGMAALTALDRGPFSDVTAESSVLAIAASSQTFVAISAVTAVAFSVAMGHLRDSLRRIRENELQLGQLLDSASGTAFIATDLDGLITWFSPGAELLLGYTGEEVVGRITPMPFHESRELLSRASELGISGGYAAVTHVVEQGAEQDTRDWTYVRRDGSRLTASVSVTAVRDEDGQSLSYLSVVRDVTDRRAAEQALVFALDKERETNQRMLELDRAKGEFVSAVSHELRTPLTSMLGYTELLGDDTSANLTEEQHVLVERIERNGGRLLHLVEDLLTLARMEDGNLVLNRVSTDLREAVRHGTDVVSHAAQIKGVAVYVEVPPEPVLLDGDPAYLERLVLNLASNAIKFTKEGGSVTLSLSVGGDVAELQVADTGMGIPLEEQGRLFRRFFRSSLATEHAIPGTGLGLHIVRSIAEAHNGRIDFESTPGEGTTFTFIVPLLDAQTVAAGRGCPAARTAARTGRGVPLEIETGVAVPEPLSRHGMYVALAQHHVELTVDLDLRLVLRVEQDAVVDLDGSHVRPDGNHPAPRQTTSTHLSGGGDQDAPARPALALLLVDGDQHAVMEHPDRGLLPGRLGDLRDTLTHGRFRSLDELAQDHQQRDGSGHTAGELEDVVLARGAAGVDEEALHGSDLASRDGLGAGSVYELVDRGAEALASLLDLVLEGPHLVGHSPWLLLRDACSRCHRGGAAVRQEGYQCPGWSPDRTRTAAPAGGGASARGR